MDTYVVDSIEFTKEQYKVLKLIRKCRTISDETLNASLKAKQYSRTVNFLSNHSYIERERMFNSETGRDEGVKGNWHITDTGINACLKISQHKLEYFQKLMLSKWSDIIVAFITAAITAENWKCIKAFAVSLVTAFFK